MPLPPRRGEGMSLTARHKVSVQTFPAPPKNNSADLQTRPHRNSFGPRGPKRKRPEPPGTLGDGTWESSSPSALEEGRGDVTITTNSLNKQINSGQSSARRA